MTKQKKLLILGGSILELEIVKRAKSLGYFTIITDNHSDWNLSPAKKYADEGWNISWSDIDLLEQQCKASGVNGVLAGFSEFRVENMIKLCKRLALPCSLTMDQLAVTRDKKLFKEACRRNKIPTIPEYHVTDKDIHFPVIVKPVDRAGSIGINVATNQVELDAYYKTALDLSPSKNVIIEDFITDGIKIDVYYYVKNNEVSFLGSSDTIMCKGEKGAKILQKAWPFKSKYEQQYLSDIDGCVRDMFRNLDINNAYATMSAFYCKGQFYFFEAGFRLSGELSYHYYEAVSGVNYLDSMIKFSMGDVDHSIYTNCCNLDKKSIVLNYFGLDGKIAEIVGLDYISKISGIYAIQQYVNEQDEVCNSTNVFRKVMMITIVTDSFDKLLDIVATVNDNFDMKDTDGKSLIYEKVKQNELLEFYSEVTKS